MTFHCEVIFCDDVRTEANGKQILVGVYPSDLVPGAVPSTFPMAVWMRLTGVSSGKHDFTLTVKLPGDGKELSIDGTGECDGVLPVTIVVAGIPVEISAYGELSAWLSFDHAPSFKAGVIPVNPRK